MKCEEIEKLLSSFAEGQISGEEKKNIESHLSNCPLCRESYRSYIFLEQSLSTLKNDLPPSRIVADSVVKSLNLKERKVYITRFLNLPVAVSFFMIILSMITFFYHNWIFKAAVFCTEKITPLFNNYLENLPTWITGITEEYFWPVLAIFILLNLLMVLSGGMVVRHFVRE